MAYVKVTKDNFSEVAASEKPVLLDFYADWCGPCRMVGPIVEEIAAEHPEYVVGKVNVDEQPELASRFGVYSIPTLMVFKNGKIVFTHAGGCRDGFGRHHVCIEHGVRNMGMKRSKPLHMIIVIVCKYDGENARNIHPRQFAAPTEFAERKAAVDQKRSFPRVNAVGVAPAAAG